MKKYILYFFLLLFAFSCKQVNKSTPTKNRKTQNLNYILIKGKTMGTTYNIQYGDTLSRNFKKEIDQLLVEVNDQVSVYEKESTISTFNIAENEMNFTPNQFPHFIENYKKSREIYQQSNGAFDPTVMPLVNYWGFGFTAKKAVTKVDSIKVDSLLHFVGFDKIIEKKENNSVLLQKENTAVQLDFGAIAKGYGVDLICLLLEERGIHDYMVEIGRDLRTKGFNSKGNDWRIGISRPEESANLSEIELVVKLKNKALASSGNYRNFYEVDGKKYGHTINPKNGFPEQTNLLSASVFANDCATADAYATAFMVMGLDKAFTLAQGLEDLEALFIYSNDAGEFSIKYTPKLEKMIEG